MFVRVWVDGFQTPSIEKYSIQLNRIQSLHNHRFHLFRLKSNCRFTFTNLHSVLRSILTQLQTCSIFNVDSIVCCFFFLCSNFNEIDAHEPNIRCTDTIRTPEIKVHLNRSKLLISTEGRNQNRKRLHAKLEKYYISNETIELMLNTWLLQSCQYNFRSISNAIRYFTLTMFVNKELNCM